MSQPRLVSLFALFWYAMLALIVLPVALVTAAYITIPFLLPTYLSSYLQEQGVEHSEFVIGRPGFEQVTIDRVHLTIDGVIVQASEIKVHYNFARLLEQRIDEVLIEVLSVTLPASSSETSADALPSPWAEIPVDKLSIARFELITKAPEANVTGRISMNPWLASASLSLVSDLLPAALEIDLQLQPSGELALDIAPGDSAPVLSIRGRHDRNNQIKFEGDLQLEGPALELALQLAGVEQPEGYLRGSFTGSGRWPVQGPESVTGTGNFDVDVKGNVAGATGLSYKGLVELAIEPGLLRAQSPGANLSLKAFQTPDASYVFRETRLDLVYRAQIPVVENLPELSLITGKADLNLSISLPGETLAVEALTLQASSLTGRITAQLGEDLHHLSGNLSVAAKRINYQGTPYVADGGPIKVDIDLQAPRIAMANPLTQIRGSLEAAVTTLITSSTASAPLSRLELDAGVRIVFEEDHSLVSIGPNSLVSVLAGEAGFGVENLNSIEVAVGDDGSISSAGARVSARFELATDAQLLKYTDARINFESFTIRGDDIQARGSIRSDRSSQAVPVEFLVNASRANATGTFEINTNSVVTRPVLKKELPGWIADYELLGGQLQFALTGNFDLSDELVFDATGEVNLKQGVARYDDVPVTGVSVSLPIQLNNDNFLFGPGPIKIDSIDLGFPAQAIAFQLETDAVHARVNNFSASLLTADIGIDEMVYDIDNESARFAVAISGLPVANVLALEGEDIQGDGMLDGMLPVVLNKSGANVTGGTFVARPPGGYLRYQGDLPATNPGLELAIRALRNFEYSEMDVGVDYEPDGALVALIRLRGKSPDVENGRAIHFNMNVSENIPALLESIRASEATQKRVQQRLSR